MHNVYEYNTLPQAIGWRVLVELIDPGESDPVLAKLRELNMTLTDDAEINEIRGQYMGRVVDMGPEAFKESPEPWVKIGDKVLFQRYEGIYIKHNGKHYRMLNDLKIWGKIVDDVPFPLGWKVLVELEASDETINLHKQAEKAGLALPDNLEEDAYLKVKGRLLNKGKESFQKMECKDLQVGDLVFFMYQQGLYFNYNDKHYKLLDDIDLFGYLKGELND